MEFSNLIESLNSNKPLLAFVYILLSFVSAFLIDKIFIVVLRTLVKKSKSDLDDRIIEVLHKPLYYSILFFGLNLSIKLLELPDTVVYSSVGILKTLIIFIQLFP